MREASIKVFEGRVAVDGDDAGIAANVGEGLVVGTWHDVAAVAAHEAELGIGDMGERLMIMNVMMVRPCFNYVIVTVPGRGLH